MYGSRILLLIPHPDDEVVGCCAAILRARQQGSAVLGLYLTTGVPPREAFWPWQRRSYPDRVARRQQEARRTAEMLGLKTRPFPDIPSRRLKDHLAETRQQVLRVIQEQQPDVLWVPAYEGGHQDHDAANCVAHTLRDRIACWEFSEYNFAGGRVRSQQFPAANGSEQEILLSPAEQETKRQALALYESEKGNLTYVEIAREVFRPLANYDYAQPPHPGKLFYQRYQWVPRHPRIDSTQPDEVCASLRKFLQNSHR